MAGNTGPTSKTGKAKVSRNALKHGLRARKWLSPEEQLDFETLLADLEAEYQPDTATQRIQVERIATSMSKLRRLQTIEDALFHKAREDAIKAQRQSLQMGLETLQGTAPPTTAQASLKIELSKTAAMPMIKQLDVLTRYQTTLDRQLSKAIGELMVLKANVLPKLAGETETPSES